MPRTGLSEKLDDSSLICCTSCQIHIAYGTMLHNHHMIIEERFGHRAMACKRLAHPLPMGLIGRSRPCTSVSS